MAFSTAIVLANVAAANHTFDLVSMVGTESRRLDTATTLAAPVTMLIRHATSKKGTVTIDRHTLSFRKTGVDGTTGLVTDGLVSVSFEMPRTGAVVAADIMDLWAYARNFLPSASPAANLNSLLIGQS